MLVSKNRSTPTNRGAHTLVAVAANGQKNGEKNSIARRAILVLCAFLMAFAVVIPSGVGMAFADPDDGPDLVIGTLAEFNAFRDSVNGGNTYLGKTVVLSSDINLSSVTNFVAIGNTSTNCFLGTFDGRGYTIRNLKMSGTDSALFKYVGNTTVGGATLQNFYVTGTISGQYASAIVSYARGTADARTTLYRIGNRANVSGSGSYGAAGFVGNPSLHLNIIECYNKGNVTTAASTVGGFVGSISQSTSIISCYNTGTITGTQNVGGIIGNGSSNLSNASVEFKNNFNYGTIVRSSGTSNYYGALAGQGTAGVNTANNYYLDTPTYPQTLSGSVSKSAVQFREEALVDLLNTGGTAYKQGTDYPLLSWEVIVPVTGVSLDKTEAAIYANSTGNTVQLVATIAPANASNEAVTWASSNSAAATVNATGLVTGVLGGTTTITATSVDGGFVGSCVVTVNNRPVTGVTISTAPLTAVVGTGTVNIVAAVAPTTATVKTLTWSSSNPDVATVASYNATTSRVTPLTAGTTTITVTTDDGGFTATVLVTVTPFINVQSISLDKSSHSLEALSSFTLVPTIVPEDATTKTVTWTSSDTAVATVSTAGLVTAKIAGTTTITATATDGDLTATCEVTVTPRPPIVIHDEQEFVEFRHKVNGTGGYPQNSFTGETVVLDRDLDLSTVCNAELGNWIPIGTSSYGFQGTFDGQGHTISGIYINTTTSYQALFYNLKGGATLQNFITKGNITGGTYSAGVSTYANGSNTNGPVQFINVGNEVNVTGPGGTAYAAGLSAVNSQSGYGNLIYYYACYNKGIISGSSSFGGLVSNLKANSRIESCYNAGQIISSAGSTAIGGLVGGSTDLTSTGTSYIANSYNFGIVTGATSYGSLLGSNPASVNANVKNNYYRAVIPAPAYTLLNSTAKDDAAFNTFTGEGNILSLLNSSTNPVNEGTAFKAGVAYPILYWEAGPTVAVQSVSLDQSFVNITVGDEDLALVATVLPEDATNPAITWSSSDEGVATVDQDGKITAIAEGMAIITASSAADHTKSDSCYVVVSAPAAVYTVSFNSGQGASAVDAQEVTSGNLATAPSVPTKGSLVFDGWYSSTDGGTTFSTETFDFATPITEPITLYARWTGAPGSGDLSGNGFASTFDAVSVYNYFFYHTVSLTPAQIDAADIDRSGSLDINDIIGIFLAA